MKHRSTSAYPLRPWRHSFVHVALAVVFAGLAAMLLLGGCGSSSGGGVANAPSSTASAPAPVDVATTWTKQDPSSAASSAGFFGVSFVDAAHGWAVGDDGTILAYHDSSASTGSSGSKQRTAIIVTLALLAGLGIALAIRQRRVARHATLAGPQQPDPTSLTGATEAAQDVVEKARYCTECGSAVGAKAKFCGSCGGEVIR